MSATMLQTTPRTGWKVRVYTSWTDLRTLRPAWEELLQHSIGPSVFSTPEWMGAWWEAFGEGKELLTAAVTHPDGELIGLAPLYRERLPGGIRRLRLVGDGAFDPDHLDLILRAGHEEAGARALLGWLANGTFWDVCALNGLPPDSPNLLPLRCDLHRRGWVHTSYRRACTAVALPGSWQSYLEQLPHEHAYGIERYTRRLHRRYATRIFKCTTEEELPDYLAVLFDLHQKRWTARGKAGNFASPAHMRFYAEVSRALLRRGCLKLWVLELDGKVAATEMAVRYGDTAIQLQTGFDQAYHSDRVGRVLKAHTIRQFIAAGVDRYDFLSGDDGHKRSWGAQPSFYTDVHFARPLTRGHLYIHAEHSVTAAKQWMSAHAPPQAYRGVKRLVRAVWPR